MVVTSMHTEFEATMKRFLKAKFSRICITHGRWYTFQTVVDGDELEMWLE